MSEDNLKFGNQKNESLAKEVKDLKGEKDEITLFNNQLQNEIIEIENLLKWLLFYRSDFILV